VGKVILVAAQVEDSTPEVRVHPQPNCWILIEDGFRPGKVGLFFDRNCPTPSKCIGGHSPFGCEQGGPTDHHSVDHHDFYSGICIEDG
jgi:hypothetical protein